VQHDAQHEAFEAVVDAMLADYQASRNDALQSRILALEAESEVLAQESAAKSIVIAELQGTVKTLEEDTVKMLEAIEVVATARKDKEAKAQALTVKLQATQAEAVLQQAALTRLVRQVQSAAQQHDSRGPCTGAGCKHCAVARAYGAMCALAGCGIRTRDGGKKLRRCITCRSARYCSEAHQCDDFQRHKPECFALRDRRQAGARGAAE
jgi:hypothetical protein